MMARLGSAMCKRSRVEPGIAGPMISTFGASRGKDPMLTAMETA